MSPVVPSVEELAVRGLLDASIELPGPPSGPVLSLGSFASEATNGPDWISGSALLTPNRSYPVFTTSTERQYPLKVSFQACCSDDPAVNARFRRHAQILTLDTLPKSPGPSYRRKYSRVEEVVAWWEDATGLWLVLIDDGTTLQSESLLRCWSAIMGDDSEEEESTDGLPSDIPRTFSDSSSESAERYGKVCELLLQIVDCLRALYDRSLALVSCRPRTFDIQHDGSGSFATLNGYSAVVPFPTFNLSAQIRDLPASPLFHKHPLTGDVRLDSHLLRKYLRYLAPETAVSKRVPENGDIYSFGVLAYELLTGTTIDGGPDSPDEVVVDLLTDIHQHVIMDIVSPYNYLRREASFAGIPDPQLPPQQLSDIVMRCLGRDHNTRYSSLDALAFDLGQLAQICKNRGDLSKFQVGEIDALSKVEIPTRPIHRNTQLEQLQDAFKSLDTLDNKVANLSGRSGCGKARIVRHFVTQIEESEDCITAWGKSDEGVQAILSTVRQVIHALLDRCLTDPKEDLKAWTLRIKQALGHQFGMFASLISEEYKRILGVPADLRQEEQNWPSLLDSSGHWLRRFFDLFATKQRPLVIVLLDIQWMPQDERRIWQSLLEGSNALRHTLVISTLRTGQDSRPPLISATCTNIQVPPLTEKGVLDLIETCFHHRILSSQILASFLHAETGGVSLFLRTLLGTLVKEKVIYFDFVKVHWTFDPVQLHTHLSKSGVEGYLEKLILSLPQDVQSMLHYLSCLPAKGFPIDQVGALIGTTTGGVDLMLAAAPRTATLVVRLPDSIRFSHDGPKSIAYRLIPKSRAPEIHQEISELLRQRPFRADFVFDAADHALLAQNLGYKDADQLDLVVLLLDACMRAAIASSFVSATKYVNAVRDIVQSTGGYQSWLQAHRSVYIQYVVCSCEVACATKQLEQAFEELDNVQSTDTAERIRLATLRVRLLVAGGNVLQAVDHTLRTLNLHGYDPVQPENVQLKGLHTPEEVQAFGDSLRPASGVDSSDIRVLVMRLIGAAGASLYYCEPVKRIACYALGLSLAIDLGHTYDTVGYFLVTTAMTVEGLSVRAALISVAKTIFQQVEWTPMLGHAKSGIAASVFTWTPWSDIDADTESAVDENLLNANYEQASNALMIDLVSHALSGRVFPLERIGKQYEQMRPYLPETGRFMVEGPLQYAENISKNCAAPWRMLGEIISPIVFASIEGLGLHSAIAYTLALRLATYYDAPPSEVKLIIQKGRDSAPAGEGLIIATEWRFLVALYAIRHGGDDRDIQAAINELESNTICPDFGCRLSVIKAVQSLGERTPSAIAEAEAVIDYLLDNNQSSLAGLLSYTTAQSILSTTKSQRLATGFVRTAFVAFDACRMDGIREMLGSRHPEMVPTPSPSNYLPTLILGLGVRTQPPPLRRSSVSTGNETTFSDITGDSSAGGKTSQLVEGDDRLDALTLMRSSLALASEQDPSILLCTLLRILCQFLRAEYAAIALCDDTDSENVRLRAAGDFNRILAYDLSITDDVTRDVCPTTLMLHTARTGKTITSLSASSRFRSDPFFKGRLPRSIICLPITTQGVQSGVVLLSTRSEATTETQWIHAKEVVATLATFAVIVTTNVSFTKRLKLEVDERTKELTNALAAKTQFLSQCSHELRSPLSAILGLAAVLEASSGLTEVQREHLRTISSSGEDLLGLINNILDHSRLESGSVTIEQIPFSLRDVVEGALDSIAAVAQKKNLEICLISSFKSDPPGLIGDPFRIKQILLNLLSNAVKFTQDGRVTAKWRWRIVDGGKYEVTVDVEDTGIGIPAQKMDKLFRSFSQIDESITRSFGGSGLGLIISKDLAKLLGGDCNATSSYGQGSKFTFSFVTEKDPQYKYDFRKFDKPRSCFIICETGPWWSMLQENLQALNCQPVRFTDDPEDSLVKGHPDGLNDYKQFDFVMLATDMAPPQMVKRMQQLQPRANFVYLVRSIDLTMATKEYNIARGSIISRPIKFSSVCRALMPAHDGQRPAFHQETGGSGKKKINRQMGTESPLEILLVDDNTVNVTVGKRILEMFGYKNVTSAGDGQQAVDAAEAKQYDLILLDLQMPVMDGFTAQKRLRESPLAGEPCVVALTANADHGTQQACEEAEFFDYMSKPLDIPRLGRILDSVYKYRQDKQITQHK